MDLLLRFSTRTTTTATAATSATRRSNPSHELRLKNVGEGSVVALELMAMLTVPFASWSGAELSVTDTVTVYPPVTPGVHEMLAWSAPAHPWGNPCQLNEYGAVPPETLAVSVVVPPSAKVVFVAVTVTARGA